MSDPFCTFWLTHHILFFRYRATQCNPKKKMTWTNIEWETKRNKNRHYLEQCFSNFFSKHFWKHWSGKIENQYRNSLCAFLVPYLKKRHLKSCEWIWEDCLLCSCLKPDLTGYLLRMKPEPTTGYLLLVNPYNKVVNCCY